MIDALLRSLPLEEHLAKEGVSKSWRNMIKG